jgi:nucleolar protein 4
VVTQAKIVFESNEGSKIPENAGGGKSRGYGFIEYSSHRWALMGLRYLNGHPLKNEAGKTQRLIVEFAIENVNVVSRRRAQGEKNKQKKGGDGKAIMLKRPGPKGAAEDGEKSRPKGKGFKKDKDGKGKDKKSDKEEPAAGGELATKAERKNAETKLALRTKIIARKRMLRKKKAVIRAKK